MPVAAVDANLTPETSTAPKVENTTMKDFITECLEAQNALRKKHGAPPLTLNEELGKIAMAWVKQLLTLGEMKHNNTGFGENIFFGTDMVSGKGTAMAWYSESNLYNFDKMEKQKGTGDFTQMIWKSTREVGIAMAIAKQGHFVVCNYFPPGNVNNKFADNIQKAAGKK